MHVVYAHPVNPAPPLGQSPEKPKPVNVMPMRHEVCDDQFFVADLANLVDDELFPRNCPPSPTLIALIEEVFSGNSHIFGPGEGQLSLIDPQVIEALPSSAGSPPVKPRAKRARPLSPSTFLSCNESIDDIDQPSKKLVQLTLSGRLFDARVGVTFRSVRDADRRRGVVKSV